MLIVSSTVTVGGDRAGASSRSVGGGVLLAAAVVAFVMINTRLVRRVRPADPRRAAEVSPSGRRNAATSPRKRYVIVRVVRALEFGGPEVLVVQEEDEPVAGRTQVVIDVAAADTIFLDVLVRRGSPGPWSVSPPYVPGTGVAGVVSGVGSEVGTEWLGRRVAAKPGAPPPPGALTVADAAEGMAPVGGYSEKALADVSALHSLPDGIALDAAAAVINDGMTAIQLVRAARLDPGSSVFVTPAAGGLGSLLVQTLTSRGHRVTAGAGAPNKLELARSLGAVDAVDYSRKGWGDALAGHTYDVIFDGVGGDVGRESFELLAKGGRFFAFGSPSGSFTTVDQQDVRARDAVVVGLMDLVVSPAEQKKFAGEALTEVADGGIAPVIGNRLPLELAAQAHKDIESRRAIGKTLLMAGERCDI